MRGKIRDAEPNYLIESKLGFILPIHLRPVDIMQGYHGPWSHKAFEYIVKNMTFRNDDSYSLDFRVPYGTEVIAARSGIIDAAFTSDKYYEGTDIEIGAEIWTGQIRILTRDCKIINSHIGLVAPGITKGTRVRQGQYLGHTGKSGWVGPTPHLHFEVVEGNLLLRQSIPVRFNDYDGPLIHSELKKSKLRKLLDSA